MQSPDQEPRSLLIVDDDPAIASMEECILVDAGYQVKLKYNTRDALESIKEHIPDGIILDFHLGDATGFEFKRTLNEDPDTKEIPVVLVTAHKDLMTPNFQRELRELGIKNHIAKPYDVDEFLKTVGDMLHGDVVELSEAVDDNVQATEDQPKGRDRLQPPTVPPGFSSYFRIDRFQQPSTWVA